MASREGRGCFLCSCCKPRDDNTEEMTVLGANREEQGSLPQKDYESLNYDLCHNDVYAQMIETRNKKTAKTLDFMKWITTFLIGVFTGMVAFFIDYFVKLLNKWKFSSVETSVLACGQHGCLVLSLLLLIAFNGGFVLISSCLVALEPVAAGSGIPEIKCYLNGIKIPHIVRLKTLLSKAVGVLFSVAGGLFVGKEGPMIHSGAIIGAGIPQFKSITFKRCKCNFPYFRTDRDKRDFVSGGAAAGVAAAFGAPIGGVLFSLEEGASFWNQSLTWRTFFCSMSATLTLNFFLSGVDYQRWGALSQPGLIDFGVFKCEGENQCNLWTFVDLLIFILMGVVGGLLGALFNSLNTALSKHRLKYVNTRSRCVRVVEAVFVAMVTTTLAFVAAMTLGECKEIPDANSTFVDNNTYTISEIEESVRTFFCDDGYYNDMATLFFNPQETAIKQLFHQDGAFSLPSLGIFFILFYFLACWTYGIMVPSGLFVPSLLCGAAYGRFVGTVLKRYLGYHHIYSGTFALIGAAAFLGGVVRMTISLTVILIESTNEISYGFPIMVTLMVAKWVGDLFNHGIYDIHIQLKKIPLLGWEAPPGMESLRAHEVMDTNIVYIYPHTRVQSIVSILRTTRHNAYPVVTECVGKSAERTIRSNTLASHNIEYRRGSTLTRAAEVKRRTFSQSSLELRRSNSVNSQTGIRRSNSDLTPEESINNLLLDSRPEPYKAYYPDDNRPLEEEYKAVTFHGLILRSQLVTLLNNRIYYPESTMSSCQPHLTYDDLTEDYPRYPDIYDLDLTQINPRMIMDVTPYMNPCPYTVSAHTPVPHVYNLFRTMGLRHIIVISSIGEILGMITRHDLTDDNLKEKLRLHRHDNR
ncbi:H(+)/Cl(-) exchange transporter 6 [Saccoglossus kowalevskii]|uniref:Chloride channel protein n=1 Tax=Saccoglossus kowalevskii TaxID=10224 RepID=A0ABM0GZK4_SACKO|nr:PREDICTED: chloride transport protein 6 [Saccoglossus kowalevskii]